MKTGTFLASPWVKLVFRAAVLAAAVAALAAGVLDIHNPSIPMIIVWAVFMAEMLLKQFPLDFESMGNQKLFKKNYIPDTASPQTASGFRVAVTAVIWICLNVIIWALYGFKILDGNILVIICLFYSVCDMICVLFFCPFKSWILKNRCCVTCRIYNWDYAMMFTPLLFVRGFFTWSLLIAALGLLVRWEITVRLHRERFSDASNKRLRCAGCTEKRCSRHAL